MTRFARLLKITLVLYWALIFTLTHVPGHVLPNFNIWDKLEHCLAYAILASLILLTLRAARPQLHKPWLMVIAICLAYGAIDEWLQIPVHRDCSIFDWIADAIGTMVAVAALTLVIAARGTG
jgi:VanZ family protein